MASEVLYKLSVSPHLTFSQVGETAVMTGLSRTLNFAISGPETWNSLPAEWHLLTLSTATSHDA